MNNVLAYGILVVLILQLVLLVNIRQEIKKSNISLEWLCSMVSDYWHRFINQ